ncbi:MAG: hypothetical protein R3E08_14335 [Thiotrichaceae bacterium]
MQSIKIDPSSTLDAGSYTLNLTGTTPISFSGTFNADTSTVKFSDADHTINTSFTLYNWQWATPITAPRTLTIAAGKTVTKAAGGTFNLDGSATASVSFAGTGTISPNLTVYYCSGNPGPITGINCQPGGPPAPGYGSSPVSGSALNISGTTGSNPTTTLTVSETGTQQLNITGITVTGTDATKFNPLPTSFNIADGGANQAVTVTCDGSSVGTFSATLNVYHNATNVANPVTYPLSCTISSGGGTTPIAASVESDLGLALLFLGIIGMVAWKRKKLFN